MESAGSATTFPDFTVMRGATREVSTVWDPPLLYAVRWRRRRYQAAVRRAAEAVRWGPPPVAGRHHA